MNVGILTFHNAHNYGAVLQAYALKKVVASLGHDVEIINYRNQVIEKKYLKKLSSGVKIKRLYRRSELRKLINFYKELKYMRKPWSDQCDNFNEFISKYLTDKDVLTYQSLNNISYDAIIVGSDQIWTNFLTGGLDKAYLIDFDFGGLRIAYSASIAGGRIPEEEKDIFVKCLNKFDYISAREKSLAESINECCSVCAEATLDPTLLINNIDYSLILKDSKFKPDEKYVFAYFVVENELLASYAKKLAKKIGIRLIELHYYTQKGYNPERQFSDFGPSEFLYAISNAEYVITNSFHGTVFSILYFRQFYSVYEKNARIENLLTNLGLNSRHLTDEKNIDTESVIDYSNVMEKLEDYRQSSVQYLKTALSEK